MQCTLLCEPHASCLENLLICIRKGVDEAIMATCSPNTTLYLTATHNHSKRWSKCWVLAVWQAR